MSGYRLPAESVVEQRKGEKMTEEAKKDEKNCGCKKTLSTVFKFILGLVFLGLGAWAVIGWFDSLKIVFMGCVGLFLILAGVITLAIARE